MGKRDMKFTMAAVKLRIAVYQISGRKIFASYKRWVSVDHTHVYQNICGLILSIFRVLLQNRRGNHLKTMKKPHYIFLPRTW